VKRRGGGGGGEMQGNRKGLRDQSLFCTLSERGKEGSVEERPTQDSCSYQLRSKQLNRS